MISERPAEVEDRAVPGHWEGDLLMGRGQTAIGTLVDRWSRYVMLFPPPDGNTAEAVRDALTTTVQRLPDHLWQSLTWDQGKEMAQHVQFSVDTAATLLVAAGDNPDRLHAERSWAHLCGVTPLPANSGKVTTRFRLNRGGDRQANAALYRIVLTRMSSHAETRRYLTRRREEGLSTPEIMRWLKRYVARQTYKHLPHMI